MPSTATNIDSDKGWHRTFAWTTLALSLVVYPLLLSHYAHANSATFDAGMHIAAGHRYWQCGDYAINPEHPPLLKLIAALPSRSWGLNVYDSACGSTVTNNMQLIAAGYRLMNGPSVDQILATARSAAIFFPMLLLVTVFSVSRAWFGSLAAGAR
jgi:hypothetical protein